MNSIENKFDHLIEKVDPHTVQLLSRIDDMKGEFRSELSTAQHATLHLKKSILITSTGASTRIEGSQLSDEEIEDIMHNISSSQKNERDVQEVQGYLKTLGTIFENFNAIPFSESSLLSLHKEMLQYSTKDEPYRGKYKREENTIGIAEKDGTIKKIILKTTPPYLTQKEVQELISWAHSAIEEKRFHPLLAIATVIVIFLHIHPFQDGNGRISRILTNLLLLRSGYHFTTYASHEEMIEKRRSEYYLALQTSQKTLKTKKESIAPWIHFFLSIIEQQGKEALTTLQKEIDSSLSLKQEAVLQYLEKETSQSPLGIARNTGIAISTVRQALTVLRKKGKVIRIGRGRATRYRIKQK